MRNYTKPVMEMEKIELNQAIAKCSGGQKGLQIVGQAYACLNWGGAPAYYSKQYQSEEEFRAGEGSAHNGCSAPNGHVKVWDVWGIKQDGSFGHVTYYEDTNRNGVPDEGISGSWDIAQTEGMDHWQSVESIGSTSGIFLS